MESVVLGSIKEHSYTMKESLRALKTNLQFCGDDIKTILVTSSVPDEGKSTVSMDLARSLQRCVRCPRGSAPRWLLPKPRPRCPSQKMPAPGIAFP